MKGNSRDLNSLVQFGRISGFELQILQQRLQSITPEQWSQPVWHVNALMLMSAMRHRMIRQVSPTAGAPLITAWSLSRYGGNMYLAPATPAIQQLQQLGQTLLQELDTTSVSSQGSPSCFFSNICRSSLSPGCCSPLMCFRFDVIA